MPPDVMSINPPEPRNYSKQAREWLESQGVNAVVPSIRSRDEVDLALDPFAYYLKRRLGLTPILSASSKALTRGTWVHKYLEGATLAPAARETAYQQAITEREAEIRERCKIIGWQSERMLEAVADEKRHADCARGWLLALSQYKRVEMPLFEYLNATNKQVLATELTVSYKDPRYPRTQLCATFDTLNYYPLSRTLWVDDYKSHDTSPLTRAESIRHSFQTLHYRYLLRQLLDCGWLHAQFPQLPPDVRVGGMRHILIQKPTIDLCGKDRPYQYTSVGKKRVNSEADAYGAARAVPGANGQWHVSFYQRPGKDDYPWVDGQKIKGATLTEEVAVADMQLWTGKQPEKEYSGEPSSDLYAKRCLDWYLGQGEYAGEDRSLDPPLNISSIEGDLDETETMWYHHRLSHIYTHATCEANPILFPPTGRGMVSYGGKTNQYAVFFNRPVFEWPDLIRMHHFTQVHLDVEEAT